MESILTFQKKERLRIQFIDLKEEKKVLNWFFQKEKESEAF